MSLPGHRPTGSYPPPCWHSAHPEGSPCGLPGSSGTKRESSCLGSFRPAVPERLSSFIGFPRARARFEHRASPLRGSTDAPAPTSLRFHSRPRQRAESFHRARSQLSHALPKEVVAYDRQARRFDVCSSRFLLSKTSTHVSFGYRLHSWPKPGPPRWTLRTHGRKARFGEPNRMVASVLCSTPSVFGRTSDAPSPCLRVEPPWTLLSRLSRGRFSYLPP